MEGRPHRDGQRLEHVGDVLGGHGADSLAAKAQIHHRGGPSRKVHGDSCERFVHRAVRKAEAMDAGSVAKNLVDGLAQYQRTVFAGVVTVDLEVSSTAKRQVEAGVASESRQHVVEEADSGLYIRLAGAVDVQRESDVRLAGSALKGGSS